MWLLLYNVSHLSETIKTLFSIKTHYYSLNLTLSLFFYVRIFTLTFIPPKLVPTSWHFKLVYIYTWLIELLSLFCILDLRKKLLLWIGDNNTLFFTGLISNSNSNSNANDHACICIFFSPVMKGVSGYYACTTN